MVTKLMVFNLSVCVETKDEKLIRLIDEFLEDNFTDVGMSFNPKDPPPIRVYIGKVDHMPIYLFTTDQFRFFNFYLKQRGAELLNFVVNDHRDYESTKQDYKMAVDWDFRPGQEEVFDFLVERPIGNKLVPATMGFGKTYLAARLMARRKVLTAFVLLAGFIPKWCKDLNELLGIKSEDICVIQGWEDLAAVGALAKENKLRWKVYLFGLETYREYIKAFETNPQRCLDKYGTTPLDLFPLMGIDTMIVDEAHLSFHALFRTVIYTNVKYQINLTATLIPGSEVEAKAKRALLSPKDIYHDRMVEKYMHVIAYDYNIFEPWMDRIRYTNARGAGRINTGLYSHTAFEKSIHRNKDMKLPYFELIDEVIDIYYTSEYMEGDKLIIFVALKQTATMLQEWLADKYPDKKVVRYIGGDSYEEMLTGDFIVTTIGSCGTGKDIPGLRLAIMTVSVSGAKSNLQSAGRLRKMDDRDVTFVYLFSNKIQKQVNHHNSRIEILDEIAVSHKTVRSRIGLRPIPKK